VTDWIGDGLKGLMLVEDGLGLIEIVPGKHGYTVLINEEVAWSACKGSLDSVRLWVNESLRTWRYINKFAKRSTDEQHQAVKG
jgi:hypothetical protein